MAAKKITLDWSEINKTIYSMIRREADSYLLDDGDGNFAVSPVDPYLSLTEDSIIRGRYEVLESRQVWDDGSYTIVAYKQSGGSPSPIADTAIGSSEMIIKDDSEVVLGTEITSLALEATSVNNEINRVTDKADLDSQLSTMGTQLTDLEDEAFGKWEIDPVAGTLTLYRQDGFTVLRVFDLGDTPTSVPTYINRIPQ